MSFSIVGSVFTETSGCFAGLFLDNSSSTDKKASRYEARISTTATTGLLFYRVKGLHANRIVKFIPCFARLRLKCIN